MPDIYDSENKNSEINLNLKMPQEQAEGSFSFGDLVLTIHNARKTFLIWCCVGVLLGIVVAAGFFFMQRRSPAAEVSISIILNYSKVSELIFPSGEAFDLDSFYTMDLWSKALRAINRTDVTVADAMNQMSITHPREDTAASVASGSLAENVYLLTISDKSNVFRSTAEKIDFLNAFCNEYSDYIAARYYNDGRIGMLSGQQLSEWVDITKEDIIWDQFSFGANFDLLSDRYLILHETLISLFDEDPAFRTADGKSFDDYAREFERVAISEMPQWRAKLDSGVYIRNIDKFKNEYNIVINSMNMNRQYHLDLLASYNELLLSFQQKDAEGLRINEAVEILTAARNSAEIAADIQKQIDQLKFYYDMLAMNEQAIRANSGEAEAALTSFITGLENNQTALHDIILDYYKQNNERDAENSILFTNPSITAAAGVNLIMVIAIFAIFVIMGIVFGFIAAVVKKYLPREATAK